MYPFEDLSVLVALRPAIEGKTDRVVVVGGVCLEGLKAWHTVQ
jgi:hypothetical protein